MAWPTMSSATTTVPASDNTEVGTGTLTFNWDAPASNGGSAITGYTITLSGQAPITIPSTSYTFTGLTNGIDYIASLTANNAVGSSTPATVSARPVALVAPVRPVAPVQPGIAYPQFGNSASSITQARRIRALARTWAQPSGQNKVRTGTANPWIFARNATS
jgi:hypothetical protein